MCDTLSQGYHLKPVDVIYLASDVNPSGLHWNSTVSAHDIGQ